MLVCPPTHLRLVPFIHEESLAEERRRDGLSDSGPFVGLRGDPVVVGTSVLVLCRISQFLSMIVEPGEIYIIAVKK